MRSALIIHSRHTKKIADVISKKYSDVEFLLIKYPPKKDILKVKTDKNVVIGIGGGSVLDSAKIIAGKKRAVVYPTTASGASMTPYATVWGKDKLSVVTKIPILKSLKGISFRLPLEVQQSTIFDALAHAVESYWSRNATRKSIDISKKAIRLLKRALLKKGNNTADIIEGGNLAGRAIALTKTNVIHATSYSITIIYGIDHGTACGLLLPYFIEFIDDKKLPEIFGFKSTHELVNFLIKRFIPPTIKSLNPELIASKAVKYKRINDSIKKINKKDLIKILSYVKRITSKREQ